MLNFKKNIILCFLQKNYLEKGDVKMKIFKKIVITTMCTTMLLSNASTMFVNANNSDDKAFSVSYSGDGSDFAIKARAKEDNTYTYVRLDSGAKFQFAAQAKHGINAGDYGDPFTCGYSTDWHTLGAGKRTYIPNKAHAKGYSATYLSMSSTDHKAHTYKGVWSPDNRSGFGEK